MRIIRLKPYLRAMKAIRLEEGEMRQIEFGLALDPLAHPVIKGLRGVRKARFRLPGGGKRGGGRIIYFVAVGEALYMMTAYPKNERDDLSPDQREAILATIESLKGSWR